MKTESREELQYPVQKGIISAETSQTMRKILEKVVSEGGRQKRTGGRL